MGSSEQKFKKRKKYGRTHRDDGDFYGHSDDELGESLIRGKLSQNSRKVLDNGPSLEDSAAASRVDAMLNSYNGPDVSTFGGASFSNHLSFETSIKQALVPPNSKVSTGVLQSQQSEPSTWPTIPNTTSAKSTPTDHLATITAASMDILGGERGADTGVSHETACESLGSRHLDNTTSFTDTNADQADIHDELPMPPPDLPRGKSSMTREKQGFDHPAESDELGSDDAAIDLPKDQYQPRPSRSRCKQNEDEIVIPESFSKRPEAVAKGKRKLKSRRKTTALARPSPKVEISDDDEHEVKLPMVAIPKLSPTPNAYIPEYHVDSSGGAENTPHDHTVNIMDYSIDQGVAEKLPTNLKSSPKKRGRGRPKKQATEAAEDLQESNDEGDDLMNGEFPTEQTSRERKRLKTADAQASIEDENEEHQSDDPQRDAMDLADQGTIRKDFERDADAPNIHDPPPTAPKKRGRKKKAKADIENTIADSDHDNDLTDATELTSKPTPKPRGRKKKQKPNKDAAPTNDAEHNDDMTDMTTAPPKQRGRKKHNADNHPPIDDPAPIIYSDHDVGDADSDLEKDENEATSKKILTKSTNNNAANASKSTITENLQANKKTTPPTTPPKTAAKPVHSPITSSKVRFRVGLSKKARIAPLLRMVRK